MAGLYSKLAATGIRKNGKSYIPYILTATLMVMIFYIVSFLGQNPMLQNMSGGRGMAMILQTGTFVMAIFSAIFLFYTNSFLIKRRKKEFGLYNILGLGKWQIARVLVIESLLLYAIAMISGLGLGILFSKLAEMLASKVLQADINYIFYVDFFSVIIAVIWFAAVFIAILLNSLRQLYFSKPIELLRSGNVGEKPPKTNIPAAVIGLILLGIAYFAALKIKDPAASVSAFFPIVVLVIIATYLLFIAGSVALCRVLQKNKRYYYKLNHFVSVSQMAYRMRRNGAGLASICILATMVLVTISSTTALYFGIDDYVERNFPYDFTISFYGDEPELLSESINEMEQVVKNLGYTPQDQTMTHTLYLGGTFIQENMGITIPGEEALERGEKAYYFQNADVCLLDENPEINAVVPTLAEDEIAVYEPGTDFVKSRDTIKIANIDREFKVVPIEGDKGDFKFDEDTYYSVTGVNLYFYVANYGIMSEIYQADDAFYKENGIMTNYTDLMTVYMFNVSDVEVDLNILYGIQQAMNECINNNPAYGDEIEAVLITNTKQSLDDYYIGIYSGLFFLGLLMGTVFTISAALIMYYKQISEGIEDAERFSILRKVGMSQTEIKQAINSQILTVFFLPLVAAGIHMAFAFPIVSRLLRVFEMTNTGLFAATTVVSYVIFAAVYILVYKATSKSYRDIVS